MPRHATSTSFKKGHISWCKGEKGSRPDVSSKNRAIQPELVKKAHQEGRMRPPSEYADKIREGVLRMYENKRVRDTHGRFTMPNQVADETIRDLYLNEKLGGTEIAKRFGCSPAFVHRHLVQMGINRNSKEAYRIKSETGAMARENNPNWAGGKSYKGQHGYVRIYLPEHPRAVGKYVLEHVVVWEQAHNRSLPRNYIIHHLNGIKDDNRPSNLVAMTAAEHIHQTEPFKKKIRELEIENRQLQRVLENSQMIFYINEN